jgi:hypothetical protein
VPGGAEAYDYFGSSLAAGDFDGDGHVDLAIGVLNEAIGAVAGAGAANVLYGTASGLGTAGAQVWYRSGGGVSGTAVENDYLAWALAAGDFDGDGRDDLAVGVPGVALDLQGDSGEVVVLYGSAEGLTGDGQGLFDATDLGDAATGQFFGGSLAAADLDPAGDCSSPGDCADELIVGAMFSTVNFGSPVGYAGRVWILPGSTEGTGPDLAGASWIDQSELAPLDWTAPEFGDHFGAVLAVGRLDPGTAADLVVGSPGEALGELDEAGCAHLLLGGALPLEGVSQYLSARPGLASDPIHSHERFAGSLAVGDFDGDGWGDLAVGVPQRYVDDKHFSGGVQILFGALFADGFERGDEGAWTTP